MIIAQRVAAGPHPHEMQFLTGLNALHAHYNSLLRDTTTTKWSFSRNHMSNSKITDSWPVTTSNRSD